MAQEDYLSGSAVWTSLWFFIRQKKQRKTKKKETKRY
jgi:hypothetical protein